MYNTNINQNYVKFGQKHLEDDSTAFIEFTAVQHILREAKVTLQGQKTMDSGKTLRNWNERLDYTKRLFSQIYKKIEHADEKTKSRIHLATQELYEAAISNNRYLQKKAKADEFFAYKQRDLYRAILSQQTQNFRPRQTSIDSVVDSDQHTKVKPKREIYGQTLLLLPEITQSTQEALYQSKTRNMVMYISTELTKLNRGKINDFIASKAYVPKSTVTPFVEQFDHAVEQYYKNLHRIPKKDRIRISSLIKSGEHKINIISSQRGLSNALRSGFHTMKFPLAASALFMGGLWYLQNQSEQPTTGMHSSQSIEHTIQK
ncbi:MAG: hypothetical protein ACMXYA_02075 [Candidatus Woesearchaeota archaeon]